MSFLSLAFLAAIPLIAAPLLLHWFDRRRNMVIEWGAMDFLLEASARKTSARRLKQWLLLLLRCLAIAALVFALARPTLPSGWLGGQGRQETIFVVDNSMSMMRESNSTTMIQLAIDHAIEELAEMPRGEVVRVMTAAPYPVWLDTGSVRNDQRGREWLSSSFSRLQPTEGRSDLLAALFAAVQAEHSPTQSARRIILLTDGQQSDWELRDETGWQRFREVLDAAPVATEIETVRLDQRHSQPLKGNVAVDRLSIGRTVVGVGQPIKLTAHLHNHGSTPCPSATTVWQVDEVDQHDRLIDGIGAGESFESTWEHTFASPGTYQISCRIDRPDDLPADNKAGLVVEVVDRIPIVVVEDAFDLAEMQQDSYFVQAALGWIDGKPLDEKSIYVPTVVSSQELATTDLTAQRVVVIPNLMRLDEDIVETLSGFVLDGGGLWIGLGPRTDIDFFNHHLFADASGLSPLRLDRIVDTAPVQEDDSDERRLRIDPFRSRHNATVHLADDKQLDLSDAVIERRFQFVTPEQESELSVMLRLSNGHPLAVENLIGRGRVIVQAVPLRLQWSDLARTQSFVVMVRDWVDYLAQPRATQHNLQPGEPIVLRLAETDTAGSTNEGEAAVPTAMLTTPQKDSVELTAEHSDRSYVFRSSRTQLPGEYELEIGIAGESIPFHVRRDVTESDLASLSPDAEKRIAASTVSDQSPEVKERQAATQSDPLWPYLLLGLIGLITAELVLSGVLARERFGSAGIPEFSETASPGLVPTMRFDDGNRPSNEAVDTSLAGAASTEED